MIQLIYLTLFIGNIYAQVGVRADEAVLLEECSKNNLTSCERLGAYYLALESWEKALIVGDTLCQKEIPMGCTIAGSANLSLGQLDKASNLFSQGCDKFEPFSCRSLARLMEKLGKKDLAKIHYRQACSYGLREVCKFAQDTEELFSDAARLLLTKMKKDCREGQAEICDAHFEFIKKCQLPLQAKDCLLLPGFLAIFFRSKLIQAEARLVLMNLTALEKNLKLDSKVESYSYDLSKVLKDFKPLDKYHYAFGFMKACSKKYSKGSRFNSQSIQIFPKSYHHLGARIPANLGNFFSKGKADDCYDMKAGYEAYAVGNLDPLNPNHLDVWKIDQDNRIEHVQDGAPLL